MIYLSLGSNIGDRETNLRAAISELGSRGVNITRVSQVWETEPVDYLEQGWFLNSVVEAETGLTPKELLAAIGRIEGELGRVRGVPKGPRTIDIDILYYGAEVVRTAELEIPHPRIAERRFVLAPLADLAPELRDPLSGRTVREMLENAPGAAVRLLHS
ncbi:MAG: 2-amino-4-hydroxy-6-hydroxymethyldihydropteridine pyrophosphokinae [Candidatus Solibacter sp.]|nr:2-amino-4-hydroxy-6-hydroxymethyldihydropteridine pyrophosphokinae [Candidatus Solibacter sp.]